MQYTQRDSKTDWGHSKTQLKTRKSTEISRQTLFPVTTAVSYAIIRIWENKKRTNIVHKRSHIYRTPWFSGLHLRTVLRGYEFDSRSKIQLFWHFRSYRQSLLTNESQWLTTGHGRFLPHPSHFAIHNFLPTRRRITSSYKEASLNEPSIYIHTILRSYMIRGNCTRLIFWCTSSGNHKNQGRWSLVQGLPGHARLRPASRQHHGLTNSCCGSVHKAVNEDTTQVVGKSTFGPSSALSSIIQLESELGSIASASNG